MKDLVEGFERGRRPSRRVDAARRDRRGVAIVPAMLLVSALALVTMALLTTTMSSTRSLDSQSEEYRLSSAVETAATLAIDDLWSQYERWVGSSPRTIGSFRRFMDVHRGGIPDQFDRFDTDDDGKVDTIPMPGDGTDLAAGLALPAPNGKSQVGHVNIDAIEVVRLDLPHPAAGFVSDTTQLFLTVSASTTRGDGIVNPIKNRAVQQVYTVEPDDFAGFDFALLANNVNCIFCHTNVNSVDYFYDLEDEVERVKVGTLESLLVRTDSTVAGAVYTRGLVARRDGSPIADWSKFGFKSFEFEESLVGPNIGKGILTNVAGLVLDDFAPAPAISPLPKFENLYLDYPTAFADQTDGPLPESFPPPVADDGGIDPATGLPDPNAVGNRRIDDAEFGKVAAEAKGAITAGVVNVSSSSDPIDTVGAYHQAVVRGNASGIQQSVDGNVVLTGTPDDPITIDGTVAIDGDLVIQGWVRGEGALVVRGNVYIPTDLVYLDEVVSGVRNFGTNGGSRNALALASGGNILIGDYQRPAALQNGKITPPGKHEVTSGDPSGKWSFGLTEMALFNRGEWAKTQPLLCGHGENHDDPTTWTVVNTDNRTHEFLPAPGEDLTQPGAWTLPNPKYDPGFEPRYYGYDEGSTIPIQNRSTASAPDPLDPQAHFLYYDGALRAWIGDEGATSWSPDLLTLVDPGDPILGGAVVQTISPTDDWIADDIYQLAAEWFHDNRGPLEGAPLEIDALLYSNNAIFSLVHRDTDFRGRMIVNGALIGADLGILVPGYRYEPIPNVNVSPLSGLQVGLQLNYDKRLRHLLSVPNPQQITLKRTLWNPTANLL